MSDAAQHYFVQSIAGFTDARAAAEAELGNRGVQQPLPQRAEWQRAQGAADTVLFVARTVEGDPVRSVSASIGTSRALPGHHVYRVERIGGSESPQADEAALTALADLVRRDRRCLRLVVEIFERDRLVRARLTNALRRLGFARSSTVRMYRRTLGIALRRPSTKVLATLHKAARRDIRGSSKRGLEVRAITDPALAPRLDELTPPAFRRTPMIDRRRPWARIIALSAANPSVSRLAGLFDPQIDGPDALLAFAWGCRHGSYVSYEDGGPRRVEPGDAPLRYASLWDLIVWANEETNAEWFDLGGITDGAAESSPSDDSDFKRHFSREVFDVGEEWLIEPYKVRATIARRVSGAARWLDDTWRHASDRAREASDAADSALPEQSDWSIYRVRGHTFVLPRGAVRDSVRDLGERRP